LQVFFFCKVFGAVDKRQKYFKELLDKDTKGGIY